MCNRITVPWCRKCVSGDGCGPKCYNEVPRCTCILLQFYVIQDVADAASAVAWWAELDSSAVWTPSPCQEQWARWIRFRRRLGPQVTQTWIYNTVEFTKSNYSGRWWQSGDLNESTVMIFINLCLYFSAVRDECNLPGCEWRIGKVT